MTDLFDITIERVQRAFEMLPRRHRQIFSMHRHDGLSYTEIGEQLGITSKMVERLIADSLFRMMQSIEDEVRGLRPNVIQRIGRSCSISSIACAAGSTAGCDEEATSDLIPGFRLKRRLAGARNSD